MVKLIVVPGLATTITELVIRKLDAIYGKFCIDKLRRLHDMFYFPMHEDDLISCGAISELHKIDDAYGMVYTHGALPAQHINILKQNFDVDIIIAKLPARYWLAYCMNDWDFKDASYRYIQSLYQIRQAGIECTTCSVDCSGLSQLPDTKYNAIVRVIDNMGVQDIHGTIVHKKWISGGWL